MKADELMKEEVIAKADLIHDSATFGRSEEMSWLHLLLTENSFYTSICRGMAEEVRLDEGSASFH